MAMVSGRPLGASRGFGRAGEDAMVWGGGYHLCNKLRISGEPMIKKN